jgi:hypothetical protein
MAHDDLRMSHLMYLKKLKELASVRPVQLKPLIIFADATEQKLRASVAV